MNWRPLDKGGKPLMHKFIMPFVFLALFNVCSVLGAEKDLVIMETIKRVHDVDIAP